ncbi:hypothetical protein CEXT_23691 [Caerostris extrusa]|uniref:Uncharacterized protein n=1 Tax=Caerostris extrusa TaxID=172846 RepID=A0AAV4PA27_CAEEX|nr:hypothetical protein CEXT_23691 [Caerostris extrusa]
MCLRRPNLDARQSRAVSLHQRPGDATHYESSRLASTMDVPFRRTCGPRFTFVFCRRQRALLLCVWKRAKLLQKFQQDLWDNYRSLSYLQLKLFLVMMRSDWLRANHYKKSIFSFMIEALLHSNCFI